MGKKHARDLVKFPDIPNARGFGPFTGHFVTHTTITGTRKKSLDGDVWYVGIIGPPIVHRCRSCGKPLKEARDDHGLPILLCESGQKCRVI